MQKRVQKTLIQQQMILPEETVLVGVSGGADSVCLLMILSALGKEMDFTVEAVHVEHGIRGEESLSDAAFVETLCKQMDVPCHMVSVDVPEYSQKKGIGMEEAARILRYEAFVRLAMEKQAKVALAHHMEDNAETVLFQMLRGSSLTGLCGMQPVRTDETGITYIRPLLTVHRKEIEDFLQTHEMTYCVDSTNVQLDYTRNFIRNVILPQMQQVNTQAVAHIHHTAAQLVDIRDFLEEETEKAWISVVETEDDCGKQTDDTNIVSETRHDVEQKKKLILNTKILAGFHTAIQKEVAYKAIAYMLGAKKDISAVHVQDLLKLCYNQSGKELYLPGGVRAKKEYQYVRLFQESQIQPSKSRQDAHRTCTTKRICASWDKILPEKKDSFPQSGEDNTIVISQSLLKQWKDEENPICVSLGDEREYIQIHIFPYNGKIGEIPQKRYTKWLDYDKIKDGFCIRTRQSGDAFIADTSGHRKKLKQYLIDEKIPAAERDNLWLLAQEHTVLWLIGGRISEHMKVTDDTKTIIEFIYKGGN